MKTHRRCTATKQALPSSNCQRSMWTCPLFIMPPPRRGALSGDRRPSSVRPSVRPSVCLMSRTSALTRKPKGLGRRNFAQGYPRSHATPTSTSRSKGQKSRWGGGILWRRPSRTACSVRVTNVRAKKHTKNK